MFFEIGQVVDQVLSVFVGEGLGKYLCVVFDCLALGVPCTERDGVGGFAV